MTSPLSQFKPQSTGNRLGTIETRSRRNTREFFDHRTSGTIFQSLSLLKPVYWSCRCLSTPSVLHVRLEWRCNQRSGRQRQATKSMQYVYMFLSAVLNISFLWRSFSIYCVLLWAALMQLLVVFCSAKNKARPTESGSGSIRLREAAGMPQGDHPRMTKWTHHLKSNVMFD